MNALLQTLNELPEGLVWERIVVDGHDYQCAAIDTGRADPYILILTVVGSGGYSFPDNQIIESVLKDQGVVSWTFTEFAERQPRMRKLSAQENRELIIAQG